MDNTNPLIQNKDDIQSQYRDHELITRLASSLEEDHLQGINFISKGSGVMPRGIPDGYHNIVIDWLRDFCSDSLTAIEGNLRRLSLGEREFISKLEEPVPAFETEDGHTKADCPKCDGATHVDELEESESGNCQLCDKEASTGGSVG